MKAFVKYIDSLDKKQKVMIYISVVLLIVVVLNQFLPSMMSKKESLQSDISSMQMQILKNSNKKLKRDLSQVRQTKLKTLEESSELKEKTAYLMSNLYKVEFAFFAQKELARSLDRILDKSLDLDIQLNFIKNMEGQVESLSNLISYKNTLHVDGVGSFKETIRFINFIESLELLMKIEEISLVQSEQKGGVAFSMILHVYGVGL